MGGYCRRGEGLGRGTSRLGRLRAHWTRERRPGYPVDAADDGKGMVLCWCCRTVEISDRMVHLGHHPEVRLCLRCAHFVHQQAWQIDDQGGDGPGACVRDELRILRAEVVRRGWHRNRFVGGRLRWLGRCWP